MSGRHRTAQGTPPPGTAETAHSHHVNREKADISRALQLKQGPGRRGQAGAGSAGHGCRAAVRSRRQVARPGWARTQGTHHFLRHIIKAN